MSSPRPKWYQFSLKSLFVLMTVGAIWFAVHYVRIGRYQATVAALREAGATLQFTGPQRVSSFVPERVTAVTVPSDADATEIIRIARDLPDLPCLYLDRSDVKDADLGLLASYPALKSVNLISTGITESGLSLLKDVKTLRTVYLGDTFLAPKAIRELRDALPGCQVSAKFLQPLSDKQHAALGQILEGGGYVSYDEDGYVRNISWEPLDEKRLRLMTTFPTIRHWSFNSGPRAPDITDGWLEELARIPVVETLRFRGSNVSDRGLSYLADLTSLRHLDLVAGAATGEKIRPWRPMSSLRWLSVEGARLTTLEFVDETSFNGLETLTLKCPKLTALPPLDWASLQKIYRVDFECPELTGKALAAVTLPESILSVFLTRMSLDRLSFASLAKASSLERLVLRDSSVTDAGWDMLGELSGPMSLFLRGTLPPNDAAVGKGLSAFTSVWVSDVDMTDAHLAALATMPSLTRLSIERCDLSALDISLLAKGERLEHLHFASASIAPATAEMLRKLLPECEIEFKE